MAQQTQQRPAMGFQLSQRGAYPPSAGPGMAYVQGHTATQAPRQGVMVAVPAMQGTAAATAGAGALETLRRQTGLCAAPPASGRAARSATQRCQHAHPPCQHAAGWSVPSPPAPPAWEIAHAVTLTGHTRTTPQPRRAPHHPPNHRPDGQQAGRDAAPATGGGAGRSRATMGSRVPVQFHAARTAARSRMARHACCGVQLRRACTCAAAGTKACMVPGARACVPLPHAQCCIR